MYPYPGKRSGDLALAKRDEQLLRGREGDDVHVGAADLYRAVRIATHAPREIVRPGELERAHVARRCDLASVEHFDDVQLRRDALECGPAQMPSAVPAEGMRDVCEPALLVDEIDAVLGGKARRDLL